MPNTLELLATTFAALFPIMNPFGNAAIFYSLTPDASRCERHQIALRAAAYAIAILLVFFFGGSYLMSFFGISIEGMRIAGGLVITRYGFAQLNAHQSNAHPHDEHAEAAAKDDISFSPMALPLLAGPGAIAAAITLSTTAAHHDVGHHLILAGGIIGVGLLCGIILRYADLLMARLGVTGTRALTKIMGFLLLCMGVQLIITGVQDLHLFG